MRRTVFLLVVLPLLVPVAPVIAQATAPTTRQLSPEAAREAERAQLEATAKRLPQRRVDSLDQAIRFARAGPHLEAQNLLKDVEDETHLVIRGATGVITLRSIGGRIPGAAGDVPANYTFLQKDVTRERILYTTVSQTAGQLHVSRDKESDDGTQSVQLIQTSEDGAFSPDQPPVRLYVNRTNAAGEVVVNHKLDAPSFAQLCLDHPRVADEFLRPIFRDFGQDAAVLSPNTKAAWQVLAADFRPDDATAARVNEAANRFDSDDFQTREGALAALQEIGQPAALVLMRADRRGMSPEKSGGIDAFLAQYLPLPADEAARLRGDPNFLLDTLAVDDPTLRRLAWNRLKSVANPTVQFDPDADPAQRTAAIAKLRAAVSVTSSPATQPAIRTNDGR